MPFSFLGNLLNTLQPARLFNSPHDLPIRWGLLLSSLLGSGMKVILEILGQRNLIASPWLRSTSAIVRILWRSSTSLNFLELLRGSFLRLGSLLAEAHELAQARVLLLETTLDLLKLLLVAEALLGELGLHHFVCFLHLDGLVVLDHDLVEAVA